VRARCGKGPSGEGSIEEMEEGKALGARLVWLREQRATSKGRSWCTENSLTSWAWLLPRPRVLLGTAPGSTALSEEGWDCTTRFFYQWKPLTNP